MDLWSVELSDSNPIPFTIVTNFQCTIATTVKYLQSLQCYLGTLQHSWLLDFLNVIELICGKWEYWDFSGVDSKPYSWIELKEFQARAEFGSGRFFNYTRCSALAPVQKLLNKKDSSLLFFVPCILIDPNGFTTLLRSSPMQRVDHYLLAKILRFGSVIEKFTDIIMLFNEKNRVLCISLLYFYDTSNST